MLIFILLFVLYSVTMTEVLSSLWCHPGAAPKGGEGEVGGLRGKYRGYGITPGEAVLRLTLCQNFEFPRLLETFSPFVFPLYFSFSLSLFLFISISSFL